MKGCVAESAGDCILDGTRSSTASAIQRFDEPLVLHAADNYFLVNMDAGYFRYRVRSVEAQFYRGQAPTWWRLPLTIDDTGRKRSLFHRSMSRSWGG